MRKLSHVIEVSALSPHPIAQARMFPQHTAWGCAALRGAEAGAPREMSRRSSPLRFPLSVLIQPPSDARWCRFGTAGQSFPSPIPLHLRGTAGFNSMEKAMDFANLEKEVEAFDDKQLEQAEKLIASRRKAKLEESFKTLKEMVEQECSDKHTTLEAFLDWCRPPSLKASKATGGSTIPPKYRNGKGETWSGQGSPPKWLRAEASKDASWSNADAQKWAADKGYRVAEPDPAKGNEFLEEEKKAAA